MADILKATISNSFVKSKYLNFKWKFIDFREMCLSSNFLFEQIIKLVTMNAF